MDELTWSQTLTVRAKDVNMHRQLRTSRLLELLQEASISHTEEMGWPRATTLDKGFLWMIAMQRAEIERMPAYDETVRIVTWPGPMMYVLYPRQYRVEDLQGNVLVRGSAVWTLVDARTRAMADPDDHGVVIEGAETEQDISLPKPIHAVKCDHEAQVVVPFSYCDLNGHMNNTRYLDVVEDYLEGPAQGRELAGFTIQYMAEVRYGATIDLRWCEDEKAAYVEGLVDEKKSFCLSLEYR